MRVSSACCTTGILSLAAARKGIAHQASSRMGLPSSLTATAPAFFKRAKSVSSHPGCRRRRGDGKHIDHRAAFGRLHPASDLGESFTGTVLGMAQTEVNPPAAAAAVPVAMVSLCAAGLAQMHMQIDEPGGDDAASWR